MRREPRWHSISIISTMWIWLWMSVVVWTQLSRHVLPYSFFATNNTRSGFANAMALDRSGRGGGGGRANRNKNQSSGGRCPTALLLVAAAAAGGDLASGRRLVADGMAAFRNGQVERSIELFDQAERVAPVLTPYLWQRGLSYYYADRFDAASRQFRVDVKVNPNDAEEIVWDIASQLRLQRQSNQLNDDKDGFPVPSQLQLPRSDPRRIMSSVYRLFRGEGTEYELFIASQSGSEADDFYGLFYLALYNEARFYNDRASNNSSRSSITKAAGYLSQALQTPYALASNDYMVACARVHALRRGWTMV